MVIQRQSMVATDVNKRQQLLQISVSKRRGRIQQASSTSKRGKERMILVSRGVVRTCCGVL